MLSREFLADGHSQRVTLTRSAVGWQLREERDDRVVRVATFNDWHRVERAIEAFEKAHAKDRSTD